MQKSAEEFEALRLQRTESWWLGTSFVSLAIVGFTIYNLLRDRATPAYIEQNLTCLALYTMFCGARLMAKDYPEGHDWMTLVGGILVLALGTSREAIESGRTAMVCAVLAVLVIVSLVRFYLWKRNKPPATE